jgi:hypothetical protein
VARFWNHRQNTPGASSRLQSLAPAVSSLPLLLRSSSFLQLVLYPFSAIETAALLGYWFLKQYGGG